MNNKSIGNSLEFSICKYLSERGFWTHRFLQTETGQPADIIAVRNKTAYLIDAKACTRHNFALTRIEFNQECAMELWEECGNGSGWFAIQLEGEIFMVSYSCLKAIKKMQTILNKNDLIHYGMEINRWCKLCK